MKTPIVAYLYPNPSQLEAIKADRKAAAIREEADKVLRNYALQDALSTFFLDTFLDDSSLDEPVSFEVPLDEPIQVKRPDGPFIWITHKGAALLPSEMATPHLFYSLRMIFNHSVPPVFRVVGAGEEMKRYRDVPHWNADYRTEALTQLTAELDSRDDLDETLRDQLADIKSNCAVILALGL